MFLLRECLKTLAGETSLPHQGMQIVEVVVKAKEEVGLAGGMWPPGVVLKGRQAQLATCVGSFWQGVCHSVCYHWYEADCSGSGNPCELFEAAVCLHNSRVRGKEFTLAW